MEIEFHEFIARDRALRCLLELRRGPRYVRELIRIVGGTPATAIKRVAELIAMEYAEDRYEGNKRIIQLTEIGQEYAQRLEYFIKPGTPNEREKWIPALLWAIGEDRGSKCIRGKIRLQKLLFLLKHDKKFLVRSLPYNFYPWKEGPFDNEISEDMRNLEAKMLIRIKSIPSSDTKEESEMYEITPRGTEVARKAYFSFTEEIRRKMVQLRSFNTMKFRDLITYVYSNFPEYKSKADPEFIKRVGLDRVKPLM